MMTKEGSAKIANFISIGAGGLMLGRGYISHYSVNMHYLLLYQYTGYITMIAVVLSEYNAAFLYMYHCYYTPRKRSCGGI